MGKQVSSLSVALFATVAPFAKGLKLGESAATSFIGKISGVGSKLLEMTGIAAIAGGALGGVFAVGKGFALAAQYETANVQLTALTGSAKNAQVLLGQLRDFSKSSPFEFPELLDASKKLLAVGVDASIITPLLKSAGEVAAGTGSDIGGIADIFARVQNEGKLGSRELLEFGRQGVPVVQELAKQFHTTAAGVSQLAENGQIGFKQLQSAFDAMTGPGGKFNGILAAQANTIGGVFRTLTGTVEDASANIAESLLKSFNVAGWLPKITTAMDGIGSTISRGISLAAPYILNFGAGAVGVFESIYSKAQPIITRVWTIVQDVYGGISALITTYGGAIIGAATGVFNQILDFARPIWDAVYNTIATNWTAIYSTTVAVAVSVFDLVSTVWTTLVDVAYQVWGGLTGAWAAGWTAITGSSVAGANDTRTVFQSVVDVLTWLDNAFATVVGSVSFAIGNFGTLVQLVGTGVALDVVRMGNQFVWVFTGVIWPAIQWTGSQIFDWVKWTGSVFENLGTNIVAVFSNLKGLITGSVKFGDVWKPLTDGFKSTAETWPGIAARQAGPLETALQDQFDDLSDKFGDGLGNHLAKNAAKAAEIVKTTTDGIIRATTPKKIELPTITKPDPLKFDASVNPQNLTVGITPELKRSKAIFSGSADSQAARYLQPHAAIGGVLFQPPGQSGGSGQLASPVTYQPQAPRVSGVGSATAAVSATAAQAQQMQLNMANQYLNRIELNTRGPAGAGTTVVSL